MATLAIAGSALLIGQALVSTPQAQAATNSYRHHVRHSAPRYFNQAPVEQQGWRGNAGSAAQRYYTDPPGWHDPSGCGIRCF
jgi:hypothetical protein